MFFCWHEHWVVRDDPERHATAMLWLAEHGGRRGFELISDQAFAYQYRRSGPALDDALRLIARKHPEWLADGLRSLDFLSSSRVEKAAAWARALLHEVPEIAEKLRQLVVDEAPNDAVRRAVLAVLIELYRFRENRAMLMALTTQKWNYLRADAYVGIARSGNTVDTDDEASIRVRQALRTDHSTLVRLQIAKALSQHDSLDGPTHIDCAVVRGDDITILACGARVVPRVIEELALRDDDDVPQGIATLAMLLKNYAPAVDVESLATIASMTHRLYRSREFGSGHVDDGYGPADTSEIVGLARGELERRSNGGAL